MKHKILIGLLIAMLFLFPLLLAYNSCNIETVDGEGMIVAKYFSPPHIVTTYTKVGNVQVPNTIHYPASYSVYIKVENFQDKVSVSRIFHDSVTEGDIVGVAYGEGRLFGYRMIKSAWLL